ncbi:hypothetical protein [Mariniradius sediminis]|jgi:hypothetical protein|uniref:Outer membrane protein beta-barrel domain-containing protein n=1 Tax=Mariniradius sediminis TaxID=2909237 RepID=A0ABS9BR26_9BACT|nr:hypothetical protein [Mariniradius sediminis]MCF1749795.1 hypothetical protein [Mariniradius sediminis]
MKKLLFITAFLFAAAVHESAAQDKPNPTEVARVTGYFSYLMPLVKFQDGESTSNFSDGFAMGFPAGFILATKSGRYGYIFELVPIIAFANGTSRMDNLVFNPGIQFHIPGGWNFNALASFETSGRYGVTPVISKTLRVGEYTSWFMTVPVPVRFGANRPTSLEFALQLGFAF